MIRQSWYRGQGGSHGPDDATIDAGALGADRAASAPCGTDVRWFFVFHQWKSESGGNIQPASSGAQLHSRDTADGGDRWARANRKNKRTQSRATTTQPATRAGRRLGPGKIFAKARNILDADGNRKYQCINSLQELLLLPGGGGGSGWRSITPSPLS